MIINGSRVMVTDPLSFSNPLDSNSAAVRPATVICRYGAIIFGKVYPDLVDVTFDHRPGKVSRTHLTNYVKEIGT